MKISPEAWRKLACKIATKQDDQDIDDRTFTAFYGTTPEIGYECWEKIEGKFNGRPKHLFWALMFCKLYLPSDVLCVMLGTTSTTLRKWSWLTLEQLAFISLDVIDFNKRNRNVPTDVWCRMTVDGTDFKTQEPHPFNRKWMSHKYNGAALKYEVAISLYSGDIVWIYGPHRGGKADISIIREVLLRKLDQGEMVEADQGYLGEPEFIRVRDDWLTKQEKKEKGRARCRHETVNGRFKNWGILKQEYRHDDKKHEWVFRAIAAITQLGIDNGDCLFASHPMAKRKESYSVDDLEF